MTTFLFSFLLPQGAAEPPRDLHGVLAGAMRSPALLPAYLVPVRHLRLSPPPHRQLLHQHHRLLLSRGEVPVREEEGRGGEQKVRVGRVL